MTSALTKKKLRNPCTLHNVVEMLLKKYIALSLGKKVTTSDHFRAGFTTLSFSQPVYSLFAADEGTNPETAGRTAIENI